MITVKTKKEYFKALLQKDSKYDGIFYVGITTTGIFCRPTCPARKPKFEHCEFFENAQQALLASYKPCKRCKPLSHPNKISTVVQKLVDAVEQNPEKRWKERDFQQLAVDAGTARRQFKKRFGMTFVAYARARRMGIAMKQIRKGESIIEAQLISGYESSSGFRDAFSRIMGSAPSQFKNKKILKAAWLDTPLGPMIAVADEAALYLLEFVDRRGLEREVERLRKKIKLAIIPGETTPILSIKNELKLYFENKLSEFKTPLFYVGTPFQKRVWDELKKIPLGTTQSYSELACAVGNANAYRAVATANGANQIAIVIPCHRIINLNGELGGYGGGIHRKRWLLNHEKILVSNEN